MHCRGFIYAPNTAYDQLASGINLEDWFFYVDFNQSAGPKLLPTAITINGQTVEPMVLLYGEDATTSGWINRGTLGGTLNAVNIRDSDIGLSTPYTDGSKSVRLQSDASGTRRYYKSPDSSFANIDTEDFFWEAIYTRELPVGATSGFDNILFIKRDHDPNTNQGYSSYAVSATTQLTAIGSGGAGVVTSSVSASSSSWSHVSGFLDNSDSTAEGFRTYLGSQSSGSGTHTVGSLSNSVPFQVGDSTVDGYYSNPAAVSGRLAYLAIYKKASWFPGGATNNTQIAQFIRSRQAVLSGITPQKGVTVPSTFSTLYYRSTKTYDSVTREWEHHLLGIGTAGPDLYEISSTSEIVNAIRFDSVLAGMVSAETFVGGWTSVSTSPVNANVALPTSNARGFTAMGISGTGTAGTAVKYFTFPHSAGSSQKFMNYVWIKPGAAPAGYVHFPDVGGSGVDINRYVRLNFSTGELSIGSGALAAWATKYTNGWWLVYCSARNSASVAMAYRIGFCDSISTFDLTSDGTSIDGYAWGFMSTAVSATGYPDQIFPYFGSGSSQNLGPLIIFPGTDVTSSTKSLWFEVMSEDLVNGFGTTAYPMQFSTNNNDAEYYVTSGTLDVTSVTSSGNTAGITQWSLASGTQTGDNTMDSGKRVRFNTSIATNDVNYYNSTGQLLGTDGAVTPLSTATNIRLGNNAASTIAGRGPQYTRFGIKNTVSTDASGPPGSGITE